MGRGGWNAAGGLTSENESGFSVKTIIANTDTRAVMPSQDCMEPDELTLTLGSGGGGKHDAPRNHSDRIPTGLPKRNPSRWNDLKSFGSSKTSKSTAPSKAGKGNERTN